MSLVTLDNSTKKLQVLLGGAVSATECPMSAVVEDVRKDAIGGRANKGVERTYDGITTSGTAVDLVPAAPSNVRRHVKSFSLYNDDTAEINVTVRLYVDANTTRVLWKGDIQTDECLFYSEDRGWYATDANANQKSNASGTSGATSEALSTAASAALRASVALSGATSQDTAQSTEVSSVLSKATSQNTAQSGDVSVALSKAVSDDLAQSTDISTALSTALSAATSAASA